MANKIKICGTTNIDLSAIHSDDIEVLSIEDFGKISYKDRWIFFWEDPIRMIFRKLKEQDTPASEELMKEWMNSVVKLLKAFRRNRTQISLVNFAEAQERPTAFMEFCDKELGVQTSIKESEAIPFEEFIPIFQKLSQENVRELLSLLQELEASGVTLDASYDSEYSKRGLPSTAVYSAIDQLKRLELGGVPKEEFKALQAELEEKKKLLIQKDDELNRSEEKAQEKQAMLLRELREAFREAELYFENWKKAVTSRFEVILKVDSLSRGNLVDHGNHRHIDYIFHGVHLLGRSWQNLRLRLVRHHGRPGIAIFQSETQPLYSWEPTGDENGSKFMLFVPSDHHTGDFLVRATSSDILMIRDCVSTILSDLNVNGLPTGAITDWSCVAETLITQIGEIPERLHYDHVKTKWEKGTLDLQVINTYFRWEFYSSIRFTWDVESGQVTLHMGGDCRPLLGAWPTDNKGYNKNSCELFGESKSVREKNKASILTKRDKDFLAVLLGEVPNFLVHAGSQHPKEAGRLRSLSGKAKGLRQKARKLNTL